MTLLGLSARNALQNRLRAALTVLGVAVAVLTFIVLRTVVWSYTVAAEVAAKDRVVTRHKVTFTLPLPRRYVDAVRAEPGVSAATWANWFGAKDPRHENDFFSSLAVDPQTYFNVYDEVAVAPAELAAWKADRQGAIVGDVVAKKLGWKVGDRLRLQSPIYPGDWEFTVSGIYTATRKSVDRSTMVFHWDYLNERLPPKQRDQIGWVVARARDAGQTAALGKSLDRRFDEQEVQTLSQSEAAFNASFLGMFSAVLRAIDVVSAIILAIMALILGNTIAMGARERAQQHGTLRAIGFLPRHLAAFVLGESLTIGALGGALGLALSYPLVERGMGRFIEENLGGFFPYFRVSGGTAAAALALAVLMSALAAALPAWRVANLRVVEALRRVA